jgi:uncharacterized membrane protein (DUF2068 family)
MTKAPRHRNRILALIAIFKFLKATLIVLLWIGALRLLHPAVMERTRAWAFALSSAHARHLTLRLLARFGSLDHRHLELLSLGAFFYAALFVTEGVGLWQGRRWAEYLTIVATASFVPIEVYEVARHTTAPRIAALVVNLAVLGYLIYQVRKPTGPR